MINEDNCDAALVVAGNEDARANFIWILYQMTYEFMGVVPESLINLEEFHPTRIVVKREHLEIALNAMGNVIGAIAFRDAVLQEWFIDNVRKTWQYNADQARSKQQ
jgi:hypothetical protein